MVPHPPPPAQKVLDLYARGSHTLLDTTKCSVYVTINLLLCPVLVSMTGKQPVRNCVLGFMFYSCNTWYLDLILLTTDTYKAITLFKILYIYIKFKNKIVWRYKHHKLWKVPVLLKTNSCHSPQIKNIRLRILFVLTRNNNSANM